MSRRDVARIQFIQKFRRKQRIKNSVKLRLQDELEFMRDVADGTAGLKQMNYMQLVDHINQDLKALEFQDKPLTLYKDEQATLAEVRKKQDETLAKVKKIAWPFWFGVFVVNTVLLIGYARQDYLIKRGQQRVDIEKKMSNYYS